MKFKKFAWYRYPIPIHSFSLFCGVSLRKHYIIKAALPEYKKIAFSVGTGLKICFCL